jgi:outer membrane protein
VIKQAALAWLCLAAALPVAAQNPPATSAPAQPPAQAAAPASGTGAHPSKVGVIEIQNAILNTKDGQKAQQEFQTHFDPRKKELDKKLAEINDLKEKLTRGGAAMADTAKQDLQRSIDSKTKTYNRDLEDANAEMQQEQQKVLQDLEARMEQVIEKYAQTNGYAVIIDVSNPQTPIMYASSQVNITKDIVEAYDKMAASGAPAAKPAATPLTPKPAPSAPATKKQP